MGHQFFAAPLWSSNDLLSADWFLGHGALPDLTVVQGAAAPDGTATAWTLTDANSVDFPFIQVDAVATSVSSSYVVQFSLGINSLPLGFCVQMIFPTKLHSVVINPLAGTWVPQDGLTGPAGVAISRSGDFWLVRLTMATGAGDNWLYFRIYPVVNTDSSPAAAVPATGSQIVHRFQLFPVGSGFLPFSRNPLRPGRSSAMLQPQAASTGAEKIGHDYVIDQNIADLEWQGMPGADLAALLTFWRDVARGMALPFTWQDLYGVQRSVRFNSSALPYYRERAYDSYEVRCQLKVL